MAVWERYRPVRDTLGDNLRAPIRLALAGAILLLGAGGGWLAAASFGTVTEISGVVVRDAARRAVRLDDATVVREILVAEGEMVAEGAPLLRVADPAQDGAIRERGRQAIGLEAAAAALTAELMDHDEVAFPQALEREVGSDPQGLEALESRRSAFEARRAAHLDRMTALEAEIDGAQAALRTAQANGDAAGETRAAAALDFARAALDEHLETRRTAARDELEAVKRRLLSVRNALSDREAALSVRTVAAPIAGRAVGVRSALAGQRIGAGEIVLEIAPAEPRLVVDAALAGTEVVVARSDAIVSGQPAMLRPAAAPDVAVPGRVLRVETAADAAGGAAPIVGFAAAPDDPAALSLGEPVIVELRIGGGAPLAHLAAPLLEVVGAR